ncbi:MAG: hypothetical protein IKF79_07680 [Methanosphaera sp.]|nr:hypothetical protein [Methanosphaera sp.]
MDESVYPTLYGIRITKPESVMGDNNITILWRVICNSANSKYVNLSNNRINICGGIILQA